MKVEKTTDKEHVLVLSRRNLKVLLAKLDGRPDGSHCTIKGGSEAPGITVKAEENDVHYTHRLPGLMHPDTEAAMMTEMLLDRHDD